jgi:hypothetical protein
VKSGALERWLAWAAGLAALAGSIAWLFIPAFTSTSSVNGVKHETTQTLAQHEGDWVFLLFIVPVAIALLPLLPPRLRSTRVAAGLMLGFAFFTGFTIGFVYWPAAILLVAAAFAGGRARRNETASRLAQA